MFGTASRLAVAIACVLALSPLLPSPAQADVTFPVRIIGAIYSNGAMPVRVDCRGNEGNSVTFVDGDVSLDTLPMFNVAPSCELHSSQGVFTNGEAFNGDILDENAIINTVVDKRGDERAREVMVTEEEDTLEIVLQYVEAFFRDRDTRTLMPPIRRVRKGDIMLVNQATGEVFVGNWRTR